MQAAANVNALRDFLTDRPDTWNMNPVMNGEGKLTPILHTGLFVHPVLNAKPPLDGVHTFTSLFFKHLCAFCPSKPLLDILTHLPRCRFLSLFSCLFTNFSYLFLFTLHNFLFTSFR